MSPQNDHLRAQRLILGAALADPDAAWLRQHIQDCEQCAREAESAPWVKDELRAAASQCVATRSLVHATQARVRERAAEMGQQEERMAPLWIAVTLAALWAALSAPFVWKGMEYLGHRAELSALVWQTAAVFVWLMPTGLITALALLSRGLRTVTD